ncbi:hypothetical protein ACFQ2B_21390 [Streptomyces stramineus]
MTSGKETADLADDSEIKEMGIVNGTGVKGSYTNAEKQSLRVTGVHGEIADPRKAVDALLANMEEKQKKSSQALKTTVETVTPITEFTPAGSTAR